MFFLNSAVKNELKYKEKKEPNKRVILLDSYLKMIEKVCKVIFLLGMVGKIYGQFLIRNVLQWFHTGRSFYAGLLRFFFTFSCYLWRYKDEILFLLVSS